MPRVILSSGFATSKDPNRPNEPMRLARVLKFQLYEEEEVSR